MPTKILFTIPNFITAGSGAAMLNIVRGLDRRRFEPAVCVAKKGGRLDAYVTALGIEFLEAPFTIPALPYATLPGRAWAAAQVFRPYRFELWHSFHYSDDYTEALIARLAGARRWIYTKKNMNWRRRAWYVRSLLASRIAAQNTDMMREFFGAPLLRRKARLLPPGVDTHTFRPGIERRLGVRDRLGIGTRFTVGAVAHLVPVKGLEILIRAAAIHGGFHVVLAGRPLDVAYVASLHALVAELAVGARVHFLGDVVDVPALLAEIDVFCLPTLSRGEGCPVALLEAMACGRACVATDVSGARDVIERERSGLIVPPGDPDALARALRMLEQPDVRSEIERAARDRIMRGYTVEREVAAHVALYDELASVS